jgi:hypothetical protein
MLSTKHNKLLINFFKHANGKNTHILCLQTDEERYFYTMTKNALIAFNYICVTNRIAPVC